MPELKSTVVCSMRNEGPFIVEWLAWYRMLGFTDVVVVTNDCLDQSPALLDALQAAGWLHHIRCNVPPEKGITRTKLAAARKHSAVIRADWVLVCDVDEFLVIHRGQGLLTDLLALHHGPDGEPTSLGISINWRVFGTSGIHGFVDKPVHQQFFQSCSVEHQLSRFVKSLFRQPKWFAGLGEHGPRYLSLDRVGLAWGDPGMVWSGPDGSQMPEWQPGGDYIRRMERPLVSHATAQFNHYMLRSAETYSLKAGTLSPVARKNRYRPQYFAKANEGAEHDDSALRYGDAFDAVHQQLMAIPEVARLHAQCCEDHRRLIEEKAQLDRLSGFDPFEPV